MLRHPRHPFLLLPLFALLTGSCGDQASPLVTYPVRGQVFYAGGQPVKAGTIEFRSLAEPTLSAQGEIQPDGTFTLTTLYREKKLPGAMEGTHAVTVILSQPQGRSFELVPLPEPLTVQPNEQNLFRITLRKP